MSPPSTTEIVAVSSDTTITSASVSSVIPTAARWRVPTPSGRSLRNVSGRMQPACEMRPCWMITAPSCSGEYGRNSEVSSSFETAASIGLPASIWSSRLVSRSSTISAPTRFCDSTCEARTISSSICDSCWAETAGKKPRPTRASARRMSCWKSTMMIKTADDRKLSRIRRSVTSWNISAAIQATISTIRPIRICTARVPRISSSSQ